MSELIVFCFITAWLVFCLVGGLVAEWIQNKTTPKIQRQPIQGLPTGYYSSIAAMALVDKTQAQKNIDNAPTVQEIGPCQQQQNSLTSKIGGIMYKSKGCILDPTQTGFEAARLESDLRKRIVGQGEAIGQIINIYQTHLAGMSSPGRPIGNFLFMGPTGSGKTRMVEAVAESLLNDARAVIKIDCSEFQHSHEIAKLVGSPPGYLGHRETHPLLSQEVLNQYHTERLKLSFVLFDEIEKASDSLWNLLLGILDKATLTLGDNRRVDFSHALIFMTSNLGASEMNALVRPNLGFAAEEIQRQYSAGVANKTLESKISRAGMAAARRKFSPEFINRVDKTVVFKALGIEELRQILDLELNVVQRRVFSSSSGAPFVFLLTQKAKEYLLREGTDMRYGARHLKRAIDRILVHPLSNLIATDQVRGGDLIRVDFSPDLGRLTFFKEEEDMLARDMLQMVDTSVSPPLGSFQNGAAAEIALAAKVTNRS